MKRSKTVLLYLLTALSLLVLCACAGRPENKNSQQVEIDPIDESNILQDIKPLRLSTIDAIPVMVPLTESFDNIVFRNFECSEQFQKDYPDARKDCQKSIISHLNSKKNYLCVTDNVKNPIQGKTLLIDMKIIDMRIVSLSARFWGAEMAGASYMDLIIEVLDAETNQNLHKKHLYSYSNPFGSYWTQGASDRNLPSDFGVLIGEYIFRLVPGTQ